MTDPTDMPAAIVDALVDVCGYIEHGQPCDNCLSGARRDLTNGASETDILADITLYRTDYPAWYAKHVAAVNARNEAAT